MFSSSESLCFKALALLIALLAAGCAQQMARRDLADAPFVRQAAVRNEGKVSVRVGVPSDEEAWRIFGVLPSSQHIQPIWIEVRNADVRPYWLVAPILDPHSFSPLEAAFAFHGWSDWENRRLDRRFRYWAFKNPIRPGRTISGFLYGDLEGGDEFVNVDLITTGDVFRFRFQLRIPSLTLDCLSSNPAVPDHGQPLVDLASEPEFRAALERLPCCTTDAQGKAQGDPVNLVFVGDREAILAAFARRGWHQTELLYPTSVWRTIKSFFFGTRYYHSPVSSLYLFGRSQDAALQKLRAAIDQRLHLRYWQAPIRYKGQPVFMAQVSRDIGVKLTRKSPTLTTHVIDADVDEARAATISDLVYSEAISAIGYTAGVGTAELDSPRANLTDDPYFTDGLRAVLFFDTQRHDIKQIAVLPWEVPPWDRPEHTPEASQDEEEE